MIYSLELNNYEGHKNSVFEFVQGVNVIIGKTDVGKTSVIRSFRWIKDNKPGGESFRSDWGGDTYVKVNTGDHTIIREKSSINRYKLDNTEFTAFGQDVPKEIKDTLNLTDINTQYQLDSHFLLSSTSGETALFFNKIANLDKIDIGIKRVKKDITSLSNSIKANKDNIKSTKEQLKEYDDLDKMETDIEALEHKQSQLNNLYRVKKELTNIRASINIHKQKKAKFEKLIQMEVPVNKLLKLRTNINELISKRKSLIVLKTKLETINEDLLYFKSIVKAEKDINKLIKKAEKLDLVEEKLMQMEQLHDNLKNWKSELKKAKQDLAKKEKEFAEHFPDICPLCGLSQKHNHK